MGSTLAVVPEPSDSAVATGLMAELSAELGRIYGDDGQGTFCPDDVKGVRSAFLVAWLDGAPAGCGALQPTQDPNVVEIKRMYVRPSLRRRGISRALLRALEDAARRFGYRSAILETGSLQPEAVMLYATSGYVRIACYGEYAANPFSLCFEKPLDI